MVKIACDASSLISMSDNCMLWALTDMGAEFLIPNGGKVEIIDHPMNTNRFELKAMRLQSAIDSGLITVADEPGVPERAQEIVDLANKLFRHGKQDVKIVHTGEAESIALLEKIGETTLLIDERTTRLLVEDIGALKKYMERRTRFRLHVDKEVAQQLSEELQDISVIRSSELLAYAYEQGTLRRFGEGKQVLHAVLYSLKYSGCAITTDEIDDYLKLIG